jgi:hypothetical protein
MHNGAEDGPRVEVLQPALIREIHRVLELLERDATVDLGVFAGSYFARGIPDFQSER